MAPSPLRRSPLSDWPLSIRLGLQFCSQGLVFSSALLHAPSSSWVPATLPCHTMCPGLCSSCVTSRPSLAHTYMTVLLCSNLPLPVLSVELLHADRQSQISSWLFVSFPLPSQNPRPYLWNIELRCQRDSVRLCVFSLLFPHYMFQSYISLVLWIFSALFLPEQQLYMRGVEFILHKIRWFIR